MTCLEESQSQLPPHPAAAAAAPSKRAPQRSRATVASITTPVPAAAMRHLQLSGWYWGSLTASDARQMLRQSAEGTFLVRDSTHPDYLFTLSVKTSRGPTNVRIECAGGKFSLDSAFVVRPKVLQFDDVVGLVQFYVGASQLEADSGEPGAGVTAASAATAVAVAAVAAAAAAAANSVGAPAVVNNVGAAGVFNSTAASAAGAAAAGAVNIAAAAAVSTNGATAAVDDNTATSTAGDGADRPSPRQPPPAPPPPRQPQPQQPQPQLGFPRQPAAASPRETERDDGETGGGRDPVTPIFPQQQQQPPPPPPPPQQPQPQPQQPPLLPPEIVVAEDGAAAAAALAPRAAPASVQLKLTRPYYSTAPTLQHLSRTVINRNARTVAQLPLPGRLKDYLCEYPYRL